jgi:hypothetical protein
MYFSFHSRRLSEKLVPMRVTEFEFPVVMMSNVEMAEAIKIIEFMCLKFIVTMKSIEI